MNKQLIKSEVVENIYEYDNFRFFLKDFFSEQKEIKNFFSHRFFAQRAGFRSPTTCTYAIDGRRNLSPTKIRQFSKGLGLKGKREKYFELLVNFNQSKSVEDKEIYYKELHTIRKKASSYFIEEKQKNYFEKWYYQVIRELVVIEEWNGDYYKLAKSVRPEITASQAEEAVHVLLDSGLVENINGEYRQKEEHINSANLPMYIKRQVRRDFLRFGVEAADNVPPNKRHITFTTLAMNADTYKTVSVMFEEFAQKVIGLVDDQDGKSDKVFQMLLELFPVSKI